MYTISSLVYDVVYDNYDDILDRYADVSTDVFEFAEQNILQILFSRRYHLTDDVQIAYFDALADVVLERAREYESVIFDLSSYRKIYKVRETTMCSLSLLSNFL